MSSGRRVDRKVDAEALSAAFGEQRGQELAIILLRHGLLDEADAPLVQQLAVLVLGVDHHEAGLVVLEMPLDQRQRALADRAEADHHDGAVDAGVDGVVGHRLLLQLKGVLAAKGDGRNTCRAEFPRGIHGIWG